MQDHRPEAVSYLERKLSTFVRLSDLERQCLSAIQASSIAVKSGTELTRQGERGHVAYIVQQGWGCSFKSLQDGNRQVIAFPVPGDCVGLRSILLRTSDHAFSTITDARVSRFEVSRILEIFDKCPHLGAAVLWATSRDEAITVEHLASVGRRTAIERTAHFFLELSDRLRMVGLGTDTEYECPLNQYILADALGLSAIHVNRVLRELREVKLMTFQDRRVIIHDRSELMALAGYEEVDPNPVLERLT
jgi:CRP-like cAMP-binding protein